MRTQKLTVSDYPEFALGKSHRALVLGAKANNKAKELRIELRHLDHEQEGRVQKVILPLPVRPNGTTAEFFRAVGVDVAIAAEIRPDDAVGRVVLVCFGPPLDSGSESSISFKSAT
jgi:hypothetical protein